MKNKLIKCIKIFYKKNVLGGVKMSGDTSTFLELNEKKVSFQTKPILINKHLHQIFPPTKQNIELLINYHTNFLKSEIMAFKKILLKDVKEHLILYQKKIFIHRDDERIKNKMKLPFIFLAFGVNFWDDEERFDIFWSGIEKIDDFRTKSDYLTLKEMRKKKFKNEIGCSFLYRQRYFVPELKGGVY